MGYGIDEKKQPFLRRLKHKVLLSYGLTFPLNSIRVWALRHCGFFIGNQVYIGSNLIIVTVLGDKQCGLSVGNRVAFGPRITLVLNSDANWSKLTSYYPPINSSISIEEDVWIGAGVIILPGITIGKCSVLGAGAVVTKDIPPYSVAVGNPAKVIKTINIKG